MKSTMDKKNIVALSDKQLSKGVKEKKSSAAGKLNKSGSGVRAVIPASGSVTGRL